MRKISNRRKMLHWTLSCAITLGVVFLSKKMIVNAEENQDFWMKDYLTKKLEYIEEKKKTLESLGEGYDDVRVLKEGCLNFAVKRKGKWGMVSLDGKILVPMKYERVSYIDNTGTIEFELQGQFFVYNSAAHNPHFSRCILYTDSDSHQ